MNWDLWINIATIASPIIGAIAIIVALCISRRSSIDAQKQIDVFMAAQAPNMIEALRHYEKQLRDIDRQIAEAEEEYKIVNPFMYQPGGAPIDKIEYFEDKRKQKQVLDGLKKQREEIKAQIQLIKSFLNKTKNR